MRIFVKLDGNLQSDEESEDNMTGDFIFAIDFPFFKGKSLPPCPKFSILPSLIFVTLFSEVAAQYLAC